MTRHEKLSLLPDKTIELCHAHFTWQEYDFLDHVHAHIIRGFYLCNTWVRATCKHNMLIHYTSAVGLANNTWLPATEGNAGRHTHHYCAYGWSLCYTKSNNPLILAYPSSHIVETESVKSFPPPVTTSLL